MDLLCDLVEVRNMLEDGNAIYNVELVPSQIEITNISNRVFNVWRHWFGIAPVPYTCGNDVFSAVRAEQSRNGKVIVASNFEGDLSADIDALKEPAKFFELVALNSIGNVSRNLNRSHLHHPTFDLIAQKKTTTSRGAAWSLAVAAASTI
jgi:hypothetical protein